MKLILDTCTFLWIITDDERLSETARREYLDEENEVYLSAVSAWEISIKHSMGRLPLPSIPERFVPEQRTRHRIESLPLDEISTFQLPKLPLLHKDPFDRMLICQAVSTQAAIVTPDEQICRYPVRIIW